jgi:hypothetical protein
MKNLHFKCYCGHTITCDCSPLEEPKQETLEEAAEKIYPNAGYDDEMWCDSGELFREKFIEGAKWQQERMYSEEEVLEILFKSHNVEKDSIVAKTLIEQFKKK